MNPFKTPVLKSHTLANVQKWLECQKQIAYIEEIQTIYCDPGFSAKMEKKPWGSYTF